MMPIRLLEVAANAIWVMDRTPDASGQDYPDLRRILSLASGEAGDDVFARRVIALAEDMAGKGELEAQVIETQIGRPLAGTRRVRVRDGIAIMQVVGPMFRRANLFTEISGGSSNEIVAQDFRAAVADPMVKGVVWTFDSPGGEANGINEVAKIIDEARRAGVPMAAYISGAGASGAYWLASAVGPGRLFADDIAMIGSIGAVMAGKDTSQRDQARGVREFEFVSSQSPKKRVDPFTDEGAAVLQNRVDRLADRFIDAVAENRGTTPERVINDFGQGDVMIAADAESAGMIDGISTFETVLASLASGALSGRSTFQVSTPTTKTEGSNTMATMSPAELSAKYPDAAAALAAEARAEGLESGKAQGLAAGKLEGLEAGKAEGLEAGKAEGLAAGKLEGAQIERDRIADLKANGLKGYETLLEEKIADGKSTGADLALAIVAAQREKGGQHLSAADKAAADIKVAGGLPSPVSGEGGEGNGAAVKSSEQGDKALAVADRIHELIAEAKEKGRPISTTQAAATARRELNL